MQKRVVYAKVFDRIFLDQYGLTNLLDFVVVGEDLVDRVKRLPVIEVKPALIVITGAAPNHQEAPMQFEFRQLCAVTREGNRRCCLLLFDPGDTVFD